jgi:hypothetical protein
MTSVLGHLLPGELSDLLASGRWGPGQAPGDLRALPLDDPGDLALLDLAQMEANTADLAALVDQGAGDVLGLTREHRPPAGWLAVDRAVVVAATYGQEGLALDYSRPGEPRVVATSAATGDRRWVQVAATFGDLLDLLGIRVPPFSD